MTPERWQQVKQIFNAAVEREPVLRSAFIADACGADTDLRSEVESLISSHEEDGSFIDSPAFEAAGLFADEPAGLQPGQRLGSYEVVASIGAGGMGEVYLAEDRRLGRKVAIKLLPASFTQSADRVRRFEREARAASALNHPNILTIFEVGQANGVHFIVTEFIEGETLRQRLRREPPGLSESLDIATQVADALNAAHKAGIVHRDIKPENIMLRPDGYVKVLDFGLAKLSEPQKFGGPATDVPTLARVNTSPGVIMGTVNYMSPEQARGQDVDARADIWSLGVVIYECAAGREPFEGETPSDTLSFILQREPAPLARTLPGAPPELERIVSKALRKNREERYQVVKDLLLDLKSLKQELEFAAKLERSAAPDSRPSVVASPPEARAGLLNAPTAAATDENARAAATAEVKASTRARFARRPFAKALAALAVLVVVVALGFYEFVLPRLRPAHFEATRIAQITNKGNAIDTAISPDGKLVAYVLSDGGQQSLWVRQVSAANDVQVVAPARVGFWGITFSPDGGSIYYAVKANDPGTLYRVPALGGTPVKLLDVIDSVVTFSPDGKRIAYFVADTGRGASYLYVADADGKNARVLASRKMPEFFVPTFFTGPSWSPDGRLIACSVSGGAGSKVITVRVSDGAEQKLTVRPHQFISRVLWLPDMSGLLMLARNHEVFKIQIWRLSYPGGEERRVTSDLNNYRSLTITDDGRQLATVYESNVTSVWVAPDGDAAHASELPTGNVGWMGRAENIDFLPDGRIVYTSNQTGVPSVWVMNADGGGRRQLTPDVFAYDPATTPDGRYVLYTAVSGGKTNIWRASVDGSSAVRLTDGQADRSPAVSPDGRWVVYSSLASGKATLWKVSIDGGPAKQLTDRAAYEPQVSPDGRWIVYAYSDYPNTDFTFNLSVTRIAVMPFDGGDPVKTFDIRPSNSVEPTLRWSHDGRSILYSVTQGSISNVWSQPLDGGEPKQLTDFRERVITTFNFTPDNKLVCARGINLRDAAVITDSR